MDVYGTEQTNASYVHTQHIRVSEGDVITGKGTDSNYGVYTSLAMRKICAYSNGTAVSIKGELSFVTTYTVPEGIDEIVISYLATMTGVTIYRHIDNYVEYTPIINEDTLDLLIESETKKVIKQIIPTVVPDKYINKFGTESDSTSYYYFTIDVQPGDVISNIRIKYNNTSSIVVGTFRFVCAYNSSNIADSSKGAEYVTSYAVPAEIVKIAVTLESRYPLADSYIPVYRNEVVSEAKCSPALESTNFASMPQKAAGNLAVSSRLELTANSVKKNKEIVFSGKISTFNSITIGQGTNDLNSESIVIDDTNLVVYRGTDATGVTVPHGLTISDYIAVSIYVDNHHIGHITIMTTSGKFSYDTVSTYIGCMSSIYVATDSTTTLNDCILSFVCNDIKEPVWVFGDSYVSYTNDRWTYYISQMGFDGYLLNGYSGAPSAYAIKDLVNLLNYGTPKYIVWALGMNDADNTTAVNPVWKSAYDELVAICNEKNITPILCTIPNVPDRSHTYKNAIIQDSGYQYINFAEAVGALDDSTWYTGMLSNDTVHPTVTGGIALASEVLKDFPMLCIFD